MKNFIGASPPAAPNVPQGNRCTIFRLRIEKYECCMTVFNSSVENRVEKPRATIENAQEYGAYCSLHKSCASENQREGFSQRERSVIF
jgi:hypothetical protein